MTMECTEEQSGMLMHGLPWCVCTCVEVLHGNVIAVFCVFFSFFLFFSFSFCFRLFSKENFELQV